MMPSREMTTCKPVRGDAKEGESGREGERKDGVDEDEEDDEDDEDDEDEEEQDAPALNGIFRFAISYCREQMIRERQLYCESPN